MSIKKELEAFDNLPKRLKDALNYMDFCVDPRYILGMCKEQGEQNTINYLMDIGCLSETFYDSPRS